MTLKSDAAARFAPLLVSSRSDITSALAARRYDLGWTHEDLDERAGWADRYGAKLECPARPQGRQGFHFAAPHEALPSGAIRCTGMSDVWLESLGLRLVLVDEPTASRLGASKAEPASVEMSPKAIHHLKKRLSDGRRSAMSLEAFEAVDRARVAGQSFKAAVGSHPFVEARPLLVEKAEAITRLIDELAEEIGESR